MTGRFALLAVVLLIVLALGWEAWSRYSALEGGAPYTDGVGLYGRFCGPGHPLIREVGTPEEADHLARLAPVDAIDAACKAHDICYLRRGYFDERCDRAIRDRLKQLAAGFAEEGTANGAICARLSLLLADYFANDEAGLQDLAAVRAWLEDALGLPVDLRQAVSDLLDLYVMDAEQPLRCGE